MTSKILLTGGTGFLGVHLTEALLAEGFSVTTFSRAKSSQSGSRSRRHIRGDIVDLNSVKQAMRGVDGVIHLAAVGRESVADADPYRCLLTNAVGTLNVLEAAKSAAKKPWIILASSATVREAAGDGEPETVLTADSIYGISKLAGELCARWYSTQYAIQIVVLRCETIYGSWRDNVDKAVNKIIAKALANDSIDIHQPGQTVSLVHYADVIRTISAVIKKFPSLGCPCYEVIYLGCPQSITLKELAVKILEFCNSKSQVRTDDDVGDRTGGTRSPAELESAFRIVGFRPSVAVEDGLRELIEQRAGTPIS